MSFLDYLEPNAPATETPAVETASVAVPSSIIGAAVPRVDGPFKTTGSAKYAADVNLPNMVYAVPVCATIASGRVRRLDTTTAETMPGVVHILHSGNIGHLYRTDANGTLSESRLPLADDTVSHWGQFIAVVIAESFQQAESAAAAVRVDYAEDKINVSDRLDDVLPALGQSGGPRIVNDRGDAEAAFKNAPVQIDTLYSTPAETHNPMEMHATVAVWSGRKFTLYDTTQGVVNHRYVMAQVLGVPREDVEVVSPFVGAGFGGKLFPWPYSMLAAVAARKLNRPVKLSLNRQMMFADVGHRPATEQRMRIGATPDGKLLSMQQDYRNHTSLNDDFDEGCGEATPLLYTVPNLRVTGAFVRRNIGAPTYMRGPGAVPGLFAMESAMDELAIKLKMDPVALRIALDTQIDQTNNKPFSSRHMKECLQKGAEIFGWSKRNPEVGSMRRGDLVLGWGVAAASWGAWRADSNCSVDLLADGSARVSSATQDIGTGTYTVMAQVLSDKTGIPLSKIDVALGNSSFVEGPMSGGSTATASVIPSVANAANEAVKTLIASAVSLAGSPFSGKKPGDLAMSEGRIHIREQPASSGVPFQDVLRMANLSSVHGEGKSSGPGYDQSSQPFSTYSFGAQFLEVEWDPGIAKLRVSRVVTVIDGGRIMNKKTATNQIAGAVVMGVGMGLLEETVYDKRSGHAINDNFADYLVATSADAPDIDVHFLDIPDPHMGEYGARGIGEIGLAGVAPAITAAVYHATGVRVRSLPVRVEDLLTSKVFV